MKQTLAARREQAEQEFNQFVELLAQNRQIDVERAISTCLIIGKSIDDLEGAASARRVEMAEEVEYRSKSDPVLSEAAKSEIRGADQEVADIRAQIAKFDPMLKMALDRAAAARAKLAKLNADKQEVSSRLAHVRLGMTREQHRQDRLKREERIKTVGIRM